MNDEQIIRLFEQLTSRCDVSNASDDLKGKRDMEEEIERIKEEWKKVKIEHEKCKKELEVSKNQVFSLLQKLSCARTEFIECEESHKKELNKMADTYKREKISMEHKINKLKNNLSGKEGEVEVLKVELAAIRLSLKERIQHSEEAIPQIDDKSKHNDDNCNDEIKECKVCKDTTLEKEAFKNQIDQLTKELGRLRKHLLSIEDSHNTELLESNQEKIQLKEQLEEKEILISSAFLSETTSREEMNSKMEITKKEMSDKENEIKELNHKISSCESTIQQYSSSIINLHSVLEQYEQNQNVLETAEIEKCRRELTLMRESKLKLNNDLLEKENESHSLKSELSSIKRQGEELEGMRRDYELMKDKVAMKELMADEMERKVKKMKLEEGTKIDKVMMRHLFIGYFQAALSRREDVAFVIGRFLDFNADDYDAITTGRGKGVGVKATNMFKDQSFAELFVKFLESESAPSSPNSDQESQNPQQQNAQHQHPNSPNLPLTLKLPQQHILNSKLTTTSDSSQIPIHLYLQSLKKQQQQQHSSQQHQQNSNQQLQQHFSKHYLQNNFNFPLTSSNLSQTNYIPNTHTTTKTTLFPHTTTPFNSIHTPTIPFNTISTTKPTTALLPNTQFTSSNNINFLTETITAANNAYQSNNNFSNTIKSL